MKDNYKYIIIPSLEICQNISEPPLSHINLIIFNVGMLDDVFVIINYFKETLCFINLIENYVKVDINHNLFKRYYIYNLICALCHSRYKLCVLCYRSAKFLTEYASTRNSMSSVEERSDADGDTINEVK